LSITIKHLSYSYPKTRTTVLEDISLDLDTDKINVILGLNGAGKTTLFDLISGVIPRPKEIQGIKTTDSILYQVQGVPLLSSLKGKDIARLILKSDYKYQGKTLTYKSLVNNDSNENEIKKAKRVWNMMFGKMSPGERRWLMISSYCRIDRSIYIFDEPTSGVDPNSKVSILNQIKSLSSKIVILSTHILHDLKQLGGNIFVLHEGKIVFKGDYEEFLNIGDSENPDISFQCFTN